MLSPRKRKALQALMLSPTRKAAAAAAGIAESTLRSYFQDPEFVAQYRAESAAMMDDARRQLQGKLAAAIDRLGAIVEDDEASSTAQANAGRGILEYALRFTEFTEIQQELEDDGPDVL